MNQQRETRRRSVGVGATQRKHAMADKKERTLEGDIVLIYYQDKPSVYARIEAIEPDVKKDWFQVTLLMLTMPPQSTTWILREEYINGTPYTMGGQPLKIEKVEKIHQGSADSEGASQVKKMSPKVVPLRRKNT